MGSPNDYHLPRSLPDVQWYTGALPADSPYFADAETLYEGWKNYEISNHLGNVMATINDRKAQFDTDADGNDRFPTQEEGKSSGLSSERTASGWAGQQDTDGEWGQLTHYDYGFRIYNPGIARFLSVDPLGKSFPEESNYTFAGDSPIALKDMSGAFKFDPKTIELLKEKYPTAYKYLVKAKVIESGNILELTESETVINTIIKNTDYHQAYLNKMKAIEGKGRLSMADRDILVQESSQKLTKEDIISAFTSGSGPEITIVPNPYGLEGASGYNLGNDGKNYTSPIELHEGLFAALENASSQEDKEAALLNLTSVLLHEFVEDFADDRNDIGNGKYGARVLQEELYLGESPTIFDKYNIKEIDENFTVAKNVINRLREGEGDPSVIPTPPSKKND